MPRVACAEGAVAERGVGVLGASSLVGSYLMTHLEAAGWQMSVCTRQGLPDSSQAVMPYWICVAPLWVLPDYFPLLLARGAQRVVALSSTSVFTKADSANIEEQAVAARLMAGERRLQAWAEGHGIAWVILRPTLIYGRGRDKNVSEMARLIRRWGFFPLLGRAAGLRQPVHAEDVAGACVAALRAPAAANHAYVLSGGETLTYREMVVRIFQALGRSPRCVSVPLVFFSLALQGLRLLPRYRHWTSAMAQRMSEDLVFDHSAARRDLDFVPRTFALAAGDLP
ncbi:MAG: NAD-dependent epimerase/dehydratase family protein [Burkholderiales bacterium]